MTKRRGYSAALSGRRGRAPVLPTPRRILAASKHWIVSQPSAAQPFAAIFGVTMRVVRCALKEQCAPDLANSVLVRRGRLPRFGSTKALGRARPASGSGRRARLTRRMPHSRMLVGVAMAACLLPHADALPALEQSLRSGQSLGCESIVRWRGEWCWQSAGARAGDWQGGGRLLSTPSPSRAVRCGLWRKLKVDARRRHRRSSKNRWPSYPRLGPARVKLSARLDKVPAIGGTVLLFTVPAKRWNTGEHPSSGSRSLRALNSKILKIVRNNRAIFPSPSPSDWPRELALCCLPSGECLRHLAGARQQLLRGGLRQAAQFSSKSRPQKSAPTRSATT